jgi:hypothetical protein
VRIRYSINGAIVHAAHYAPDGRAEHPERNKGAFVRGWLTDSG